MKGKEKKSVSVKLDTLCLDNIAFLAVFFLSQQTVVSVTRIVFAQHKIQASKTNSDKRESKIILV